MYIKRDLKDSTFKMNFEILINFVWIWEWAAISNE